MTENIDKFTQMEYMVIDELKEVYDPVIMTEEEIHTEFVRISNAIGICLLYTSPSPRDS